MKGIGTETKKAAKVGLKTDYFLPKNGDKSFGKITRVSSSGYEITDEKTKKVHKFKFYDPNNDPTSVRGTREEVGEELDKDDESTVKKVVAKLKKASQAHADQAKTLTKDLQDETDLTENFRKLAMKGIGTETKKGARVGLKTDYYLPSNGDKSFGKIMRVSKDGYEIEDEKTKKTYKFKFYDPMKAKQMKENYDIGNDYAKHTLRVTPGQSEDDVDEMLGIMQKKTTSMREALAKVWGLDEGQSPFDEKITRGTGKKGLEKSLEKLYGPKRKPKKEPNKEEKDSKKTMMGGKQTPVQVDPKMEK